MRDDLNIPPVPPPTPEDLKAIEDACRDYASGWFTADAERMRRALHPDLVKRTIWYDMQENTMRVGNTLTADAMVGFTREGGGSNLQDFEKAYEVVILDVFRDIATTKVSSYPYMDYLHLAKINGRWWIMNCLYKVRQGEHNHP